MLKPMSKTHLIASVSEAAGLTKKDASAALEALAAVIRAELENGGGATIPGVLKIACRERPARIVRNPATGGMVERSADRLIKVNVDRNLKQAIRLPG